MPEESTWTAAKTAGVDDCIAHGRRIGDHLSGDEVCLGADGTIRCRDRVSDTVLMPMNA
ncbi:hypothetical protein [Azospirillum sp. A39]|uniref:hypothetical protein n=1 Tax=Azospirillum sp. A39 TaxID=3462279 RepID=UPI0040453280